MLIYSLLFNKCVAWCFVSIYNIKALIEKHKNKLLRNFQIQVNFLPLKDQCNIYITYYIIKSKQKKSHKLTFLVLENKV